MRMLGFWRGCRGGWGRVRIFFFSQGFWGCCCWGCCFTFLLAFCSNGSAGDRDGKTHRFSSLLSSPFVLTDPLRNMKTSSTRRNHRLSIFFDFFVFWASIPKSTHLPFPIQTTHLASLTHPLTPISSRHHQRPPHGLLPLRRRRLPARAGGCLYCV